jgi:hypothetical protein
MQALGVSSKQAAKARQAFERSAREAGFFASGEDRLVRPRVDLPTKLADDRTGGDASDRSDDDVSDKGGKGGGGGSDQLHPFIRGLLDTLPTPESNWAAVEQAKWLQTAASIFGLIYKSAGSGEIEVKIKGSTESKAATDQ